MHSGLKVMYKKIIPFFKDMRFHFCFIIDGWALTNIPLQLVPDIFNRIEKVFVTLEDNYKGAISGLHTPYAIGSLSWYN